MEEWKDKVFKSVQRVEKAQAPPHVYGKILKRIRESKEETASNPQYWYAIAASIAILLMINVFALLNYTNQMEPTDEAYYSEIISTYNIYDFENE